MSIKTTSKSFHNLLLSQMPINTHNRPYLVENITEANNEVEPGMTEIECARVVYRVSDTLSDSWAFFISSDDLETWEATLTHPDNLE